MIAGSAGTEGMSDTAIEGAAAAFEGAGNAEAGDALLRSTAFRYANANGITQTSDSRST
jgi:hypothetical protein